VEVELDEAQYAWLSAAAEREQPAVTLARMVQLLLDRGRAADDESNERRQHQLAIYRESGYDEHHPDYPDVPAPKG
jgi:hypothetical protein